MRTASSFCLPFLRTNTTRLQPFYIASRKYAKARNLWSKQLSKVEHVTSYNWDNVREKDLRKEVEKYIAERKSKGFDPPPVEFFLPDYRNMTDFNWEKTTRNILRQDARRWKIIPDIYPKLVNKWPQKLFYPEHDGQLCHRGNYLTCKELQNHPKFNFNIEGEEKSNLYSIVVIDPDMPVAEYPTWGEFINLLITNIPGKDVSAGDTLVEWVPPIPFQNGGTHRLVYQLLLQTKGKINVEMDITPVNAPPEEKKLVKKIASDVVEGRGSFDSQKFCEQYQLEPRGISWVSTEWDESVSAIWEKFGIPEPVIVENHKNIDLEAGKEFLPYVKQTKSSVKQRPDRFKFE